MSRNFSYIKISLAIVATFAVGIAFANGVILIGKGGLSLFDIRENWFSQKVAVTENAPVEEEKKGSDDSTVLLPVNQYNVKGKPLYVNAEAFIVGDVETGEIILERSINKVYPIASVSKLVTALVGENNIPAKQEVIVSKTALATYGASGGLSAGEKVRAGDLYYPLLLESSNDVAKLISEQLPDFVEKMNLLVKDIGMNNTSFEEASGLSAENVSTASDLFTLSRYIYKEAPYIWDLTRIRQFSLLRHSWINENFFLKFDFFLGGKNGYTDEARRTTVSLFELPIKTSANAVETRTIAVILLQTDTREQDATRLIDFVKKNVSLEKQQ